jgi:hypothetical protein
MVSSVGRMESRSISGGLVVNDQLELGWLNDREVTWFLSLHNAAGVLAD